MILINILEKNARELRNKTALMMRIGYRTVSLSYKDVYELSLKTAIFLEKSGLKKGDKVLILAPNSPYWICVWWGSMLGGYVPVPLNIQSTGEMVKKIAEQTGAKIIFKYLHYKQPLPSNLSVFDAEFLKEIVTNSDSANFRKPLINPFDRLRVDPERSRRIKEEDIAELMYTSGTTGDPKGVILTHKNLYSNLNSLAKIIPISPDDRFLSILPLSHIYEQMCGFLLPFYRGCQIIYAHSPTVIRDLLKEHRITVMAAVPEFLRIMISKIEAKAEEEGKKKLLDKMMALSLKIGNQTIQRLIFHSVHKKFGGKLHTVASGGAPLDPLLEKKWSALGIDLLQGYGLTETSPLISCNTYKDHRLGSVGKILPGVEVKIAADTRLPDGQGEILVKGSNVFQGYFKNEEKTKEAFTADACLPDGQGWFQTGDIGELDKEGFLYIKGRKKYMIKGPGAQNVYPEDIEFELNKIPEVKDSCVVGLEKSGGQVEIHAVFLGENIKDPEKIIEQANAKLASYQQITGWSIWPEEDFPRSATRKVKKEEVLKWLGASKIPTFDAGEIGIPTSKLASTPLVRLLAEITDHDVSQISQKTKIVSELNLDSLLRVELVSRIEEGFGITVDEAKIGSETTVLDLEEMIKREEPIKKAPSFKNWPLSIWISLGRALAQILIIFPLARIFVKLEIEGKEQLENLPSPAIFMPNHISYLDSLVLIMALPLKIRRHIAFAAAQDVLYEQYKKIAWLAELFFNTFPFPRQEHENIKTGLEHMGRLLDRNWSIAVYPEGKISLTGKLLPLKRGAGLVGVEMDSCVVPVKISGTADIIPAGKIMPRKRGLVTVKFGKPIKFKKFDSYIEVTEKLEEIMKEF